MFQIKREQNRRCLLLCYTALRRSPSSCNNRQSLFRN